MSRVMEVGSTFRLLPWPKRKYHFRGKVDGRYVCKWWRRSKQRWEYEVFLEDEIAHFVIP